MAGGRSWTRRRAEPFAEAIEAIETMLRMGFVGSARRTLSMPQWIERLDEDRRACPAAAARYDRAIERLSELEELERLNGRDSLIDPNERTVQRMIRHGRLSPERVAAMRVGVTETA